MKNLSIAQEPGFPSPSQGEAPGMAVRSPATPKRSLWRTVLVLLFSVFAAPALATIDIQHWKTPNGVGVYFVEAHELPIVDIKVVFRAGSARDPADLHGLAMFTNSLLDEGAGGMHANEIAYEFERVGAVYGADTTYDSASVNLRSLMEEDKLKVALATFRRVLVEPDFPDEALERQRKRFLIGIQQKQQSPGNVAGDAFIRALYGDHPYGHPSEGTAESVQRFTREAVVDFHRRHYVAANAIIVMVGDLDRAKAEAIARQLAEALPEGAAPPPLPAPPAAPAERDVRINHPSTQMHILLGQPGMRANDPDYFPLYVGNHVLGGSGLVSRLFEEVRNKRGLSYSAYSYFTPRRVAGPFVAGLQTRADQAEEALSVLRGEIARFTREGPTAKELEAAKKNITGGFPLRLDSNSDILGYTALIAFYGLPLDFLDTYTARVEAVTAEDIRDAFRRRLDPERMTTVMVGPLEEESGAAAPGD